MGDGMKAKEIIERGLFWLADEVVPERHFAPGSAIWGTLLVGPDGKSSLELDGVFPRSKETSRSPFDPWPTECAIVGQLKGTGSYVRMQQVMSNGTQWRTQAPSFEKFMASSCLVGDKAGDMSVAGPGPNPCYLSIQVSLEGFEPWLGLKSAATKKTPDGLIAQYQQPKDHFYNLKEGSLEIRVELTPSRGDHTSSLTITQRGLLTYTSRDAMSLDKVKEVTSRIEDLLILLTDCERGLDWPQIRVNGQAGWHTLYYSRTARPGSEMSARECWTKFPRLAADFGNIFDAWFAKHELLGSGFYLYLGNRRGLHLYEENRFVNLVWGLEALHRRTQTQRAAKPTLSDRLNEIFSQLPWDLNAEALKAFSVDCAKRRNDISHFGGPRATEKYRELLDDLWRLTEALDPLYHASILRVIGVPDDQIRWIFTEGPAHGERTTTALEAVGLNLPPRATESPDA